MPIDHKTVQHVATLASLSLTDEETLAMTRDLGAIVGHIAELAAIDTTGVPPTSHVSMGRTAWRDDVVKPGLTHEEALAQAPRTTLGGFAVPGFVES